jgi:hypothetical protein
MSSSQQPPHPALRATFSHKWEKGQEPFSRLREKVAVQRPDEGGCSAVLRHSSLIAHRSHLLPPSLSYRHHPFISCPVRVS